MVFAMIEIIKQDGATSGARTRLQDTVGRVCLYVKLKESVTRVDLRTRALVSATEEYLDIRLQS